MSAGSGDRLARGAHSAQFKPAEDVTQEKWAEIWGGNGETEIERLRRLKITGPEQDAIDAEVQKQIDAARGVEEKKKASKVPDAIPFRAIHDKIVVFRTELEDEKVGSFFVPDEAKERPQEGKVVAVGPGRYIGDQFIPVTVRTGETVLFGKYSGTEVKVGDKMFLILREEEILLVFEPKSETDGEVKQPGSEPQEESQPL